MESQFELIREQQKASWNRCSSGWKKWNGPTMSFLQPMGDEMLRILALKENDLVLDVASGTGEPGLSIASRVKKGRVVLTDLADQMLDIALENAKARVITNIETKVCDVSDLPFRDYTFDVLSCRFGFMFFPDMLLAAREMLRVLKPEGRFAAAVWNVPEKNSWITAIMDVLTRHLELPATGPDAPGMFRCAKDGLMRDLLLKAGYKNIAVEVVSGSFGAETIDLYWQMMNEIVAPVSAALNMAHPTVQKKVKAEVYQRLAKEFPLGQVKFECSALVIYAEKERFDF
jgi:SAM-dependent methyltransferase